MYHTIWTCEARHSLVHIFRFEANPILRYMMKYGMRSAFVLYGIIYTSMLTAASYGTSIVEPLTAYETAGMLMFGLAAAHL